MHPTHFTTALLHHAADPFRLLVETITDYAIYVLDPHGRIASWNIGAERIKGYAANEVIGKPFAMMFVPEDAASGKPQRDMDNALAHGRVEGEGRRVRRDGSTFWAIYTVTALRDDDRHIGFAVVIRDITERKEYEDRLRRTNEELVEANRQGEEDLAQMQALIRHAPAGIAFLDLDFRYKQINERLAMMNGFPPEYHMGRTVEEVLPDLWPKVGPIFHRVRDTCEAVTDVEVTGRVPATPGEDRHWLGGYYPVRSQGGQIIGIGVLAVETTGWKRAEEDLRLRDRAIQHIAEGILITDPNQPDNPIIYASPGFERLTGYAAAEVVGRNCRFLQGPDTDRATVTVVREAIRDGRPCAVEILNYKKDGTKFWSALSISSVSDGHLTYFVGVQADVTARRRLEEQFRQAQKMEAVGQLAGGVAHDFNNLLTIINGYSEMMLTGLPPGDPKRELLTQIHLAGRRAGSLTRQLLAFSRNQVLEPKVLNLNTVISDTEKMLRRLIGEDVHMAVNLDPALAPVRVDPGQIEQVLINLCVNARDAMPTGGNLTVETRNVTLDESYPHMQPGNYSMLTVTDTGTGMDEATKAHIFEPFFTTKEPSKGTGLGLAMVHGVVKQSGGHIEVNTHVGRGTTFKVYLPQVRERVASGKSFPGLNLMPVGTETVLLVEDEEAVRLLARHVLQGCGYTVLEAGDGREAIRVVEGHQGPLPLIISDVVMPHLGGRQLAEKVAALRPGVKVLFLSGYTDDAMLRHGIVEEQYAFLQKPFTPSGLAIKVRETLDHFG